MSRVVTVKMPVAYVDGLRALVSSGRYESISDAIRVAVRALLDKELYGVEKHYKKVELKL